MNWTDNPGLDADNYYDYCEERQAIWEARCIKCEECGQPIDPQYQTFCYIWGEAHWHIECMKKKLKKWIPDKDILEMTIDAFDEFYKDTTPDPEDD
ncbi:MAG: hypothetical protein IKG03_00470 [Clostridiales bacterium]|nr:hypothetical protein [Clostridiales bacterium]